MKLFLAIIGFFYFHTLPNSEAQTPNCNQPVARTQAQSMQATVASSIEKKGHEVYLRLEKDFKTSPLCKIQNGMTKNTQILSALTVYSSQIADLYQNNSNDVTRINQNHDDQKALDLVFSDFHFDSDVESKLREQYKTLTPMKPWVPGSNDYLPEGAPLTKRREFIFNLLSAMTKKLNTEPKILDDTLELLFDKLHMENCTFLSEDVFLKAYVGATKYSSNKPHILSIVDSTMPYTARRMFVLDITPGKEKVLHNNLVALGAGPTDEDIGDEWGASPPVSDENGKHRSSYGFLETGGRKKNTIFGQALYLNGKEAHNQNVDNRDVLYHKFTSVLDPPFIQLQRYSDDHPNYVNKLLTGDTSPDDGVAFWAGNVAKTPVYYLDAAHTIPRPGGFFSGVGHSWGCLGVPEYKSKNRDGKSGFEDELVRDDIENGSLIYIYATQDQILR